jgi:SAM-dependent methyltransferase
LNLASISPQLRARFWRYLRDSFGQHYPELASIFHLVSISSEARRYLRVKEIFETLEAFKIMSSIILMAQEDDNVNNQQQGSSNKIDTIYDLACGHGLLGILLAYRFPTKKVVCVDLEARDSFQAFRSAFHEIGESYKEEATPLSNLEYREADLLSVESEINQSESFLIALHACNEANKEVVDMAKRGDAMWAVMPCCIRSKLYLNGAPVLDLDSESRYNLLCGAFAEANDAQLVRAIDRHITARPIVIAGGMFPITNIPVSSTSNGTNDDTKKTLRTLKTGGRGSMPPL